MSGTGAPDRVRAPRAVGGAKVLVTVAAGIAASVLAAFLLGLLAPFLLWLLAVAGLLGLLAFFVGVGIAVVGLLAAAVRAPKAAAQGRQSATIESLLTRRP